jgi:dTDP-4-dehydrorhamnose 3,5-epimerase
MPFEFRNVAIPGPLLIKPQVFGDSRGFFLELYKHSDFALAGIREHLVQDNYSRSEQGVLRGLHFQKAPYAQGKLVVCLQGEIFDVAVDIRKGSPSFGKGFSVRLSEENRLQFYVPPGFAHGFQVMSESADVLYKCTAEYSPANDRGIIWNDPDIAVPWPLGNPLLSAKDRLLPLLKNCDSNFEFRGEP